MKRVALSKSVMAKQVISLILLYLLSSASVWGQLDRTNRLASQNSQTTLSTALPNSQQRVLQDRLRSRTSLDEDPSFVEEVNEPNVPLLDSLKEQEEPLSSVELLMTGQAPNDVNLADLRQYGYDVFRQRAGKFKPLLNVPVGPDYIVGPGDRFTLTLWGRHNDRISVQVGRDGNIALPEVGVVSVSGMTFGKLQDYLQSELQRKFTDFRMHIAMGRLRAITVYVVGEAKVPGSYTLSSLSTAIDALFAAGGPSKNGSLRQIKVQRIGRPPRTVDLYEFLMGGDKTNSDLRLEDGDTIYIPLIQSVVGIAGNVRRPAIYEIIDSITLQQALDYAGGVNAAGLLQRVQIERIENHRRRIVADYDLTEVDASNMQRVHDGDVIKVFPVLEREEKVIYLEGHVQRPGKYELKPNMRLSNLFTSNELFRPQVNLEYAEIERMVPPDLNPITLPFNLGQVMKGNSDQDYLLEQFDIVRFYRWDQKGKRSVSVSGMVYDPKEYRFVEGMRVKDLIAAAGGLENNSYLRKAEITRRHISQDGVDTEKIDINLALALQGDPEQNIVLQDYDHLVVRPIPELDFNDVVEIAGEVMFPGEYPIRKGERLSSIIERAGGYTNDAYLRGAVFTRASAMLVQQRRMEDLVAQLEESLLTTTSQGLSGALDSESVNMQKANLEAKKELIAKLKTVRIEGRVVIKLSRNEFQGSKYDLELESGDFLTIPRVPGIINVVGEVFNPTALLYEQGQTLEQYLAKVGGMTKEADRKQVSVIRADGSVISMMQKRSSRLLWDSQRNQWQLGGSFLSTKLDPGDTIVVPKKLDYTAWLRNTKDITQILFQVAMAAGVVIAL